jgi:tetratricopeptide (TPR) repeat protein
MVYAYLQMGRDAEARKVIAEASQIRGININGLAAPYAIGAMNARLAVERGDWQAAMNLPMPPQSAWTPTPANTYFARALGAARTGNIGMAREELAKLAEVQRALEDKKDKYWATEVEVQRLIVAGWIARAQKNDDDALRLMRAAADLEDRNEKHIVTPGRLAPAREQLGELLLEVGQPKAALAEFEMSRTREPNRFHNYYLSALAAEGAGDKAAARGYWSKLVALGAKADAGRPEIVRAKAALL